MRTRPISLVPETFDRGVVLAAAASASLAVAAGAHLAAFPAHRGEGVLVGGFFIVVGVVQLAAALIPRSPRVRVGIVAGNLTLLVLWAISRTVGLPFGAHAGTAEAVGVLDVAAAVAEAAAIAAVLMLPRRLHRRSGAAPSLGLIAVATTVALAGALLIPASHATDDHRGSTATHSHAKPHGGVNLHPGAAPSDIDMPVTRGNRDDGDAVHAHDEARAHP